MVDGTAPDKTGVINNILETAKEKMTRVQESVAGMDVLQFGAKSNTSVQEIKTMCSEAGPDCKP